MRMLKPLGERLDLVVERREVRDPIGNGNRQGKGTFEVHGAQFWDLWKLCPAQLEETPRKLQSTRERAGEMPSPLKEHTHNFGQVEQPGKDEGKMGNWGKIPRFPSLPYS